MKYISKSCSQYARNIANKKFEQFLEARQADVVFIDKKSGFTPADEEFYIYYFSHLHLSPTIRYRAAKRFGKLVRKNKLPNKSMFQLKAYLIF